MSKFNIVDIWRDRYGDADEAIDNAGRKILISACNNPNSRYQPTIDHIRPLSKGGLDVLENIEICNRYTNFEKGDNFPHWRANNRRFHAEKMKNTSNGYIVVEDK